MKKSASKGMALIIVLMILAIMVLLASTMTERLTLSLKRTEGTMLSQGGYWYAQATAELARMILEDDFANNERVSLDQNWATPDSVFPLENGNISGTIIDMRSCFNINAVAAPDNEEVRATGVTQLQRLLEALDIDDYLAETIADSTRDWIDADKVSLAAQGAEDSFYEALSVPHLSANVAMIDISELRALRGVTSKVFSKISPYLCAIPSKTQHININTVRIDQAEILYAIFPERLNLSIRDFEKLLDERDKSGWKSVDEFFTAEIFKGLNIPSAIKSQLSVQSEFFQLNGIVQFSERLIRVKLLFKIENKKAYTIRYQSSGLGS
ncbi:general secretion pathway protein K [Psychromonas sp. CNPT3]|uniref:type II secretion system minor pseudopilin GspK n=1 Tax=Psychromonas sp. CNPT3 TaxID=314282 RepID=UPI00006E70A2|nr:type II secretion system minor pseudopilin GspK [Psychromonas sp. CNPT3]AGH80128.1 general secretion pathway protein K [Psychromonas sp. CNPT3]